MYAGQSLPCAPAACCETQHMILSASDLPPACLTPLRRIQAATRMPLLVHITETTLCSDQTLHSGKFEGWHCIGLASLGFYSAGAEAPWGT